MRCKELAVNAFSHGGYNRIGFYVYQFVRFNGTSSSAFIGFAKYHFSCGQNSVFIFYGGGKFQKFNAFTDSHGKFLLIGRHVFFGASVYNSNVFNAADPFCGSCRVHGGISSAYDGYIFSDVYIFT